jgi:hypothetical protein
MRLLASLVTLCGGTLISLAASASPCDAVDRALTDARKIELAPVIAKQIKVRSVDVLQSYRDESWHIIYVNTHVSDNAFIFFKSDPLKSQYLVAWGGQARPDEEADIAKWTRSKAKGIPPKLAKCFAWHVTKDRDM